MSAQNQLPNLDKIFRDDDEADFVPSGGYVSLILSDTIRQVQVCLSDNLFRLRISFFFPSKFKHTFIFKH